MDSFSYIIRDRARNQLLAYHDQTLSKYDDPATAIIARINDNELLRGVDYGSIVLGWETERHALVPRELYKAEHRRDYLAQLTPLTENDTVEAEWHNELDAYLLFATNEDALSQVKDQLRTARSQHYVGGPLKTWARRSLRSGEACVSAAFRGNRIFVAVHQAGSLQFCNTFTFDTPQDVLYYLLLAYDHCGMLPGRVPLYLSGGVARSGEVHELLYTYVEEVKFSEYGAPPALPTELASLDKHLYFDLLCLG